MEAIGIKKNEGEGRGVSTRRLRTSLINRAISTNGQLTKGLIGIRGGKEESLGLTRQSLIMKKVLGHLRANVV